LNFRCHRVKIFLRHDDSLPVYALNVRNFESKQPGWTDPANTDLIGKILLVR